MENDKEMSTESIEMLMIRIAFFTNHHKIQMLDPAPQLEGWFQILYMEFSLQKQQKCNENFHQYWEKFPGLLKKFTGNPEMSSSL